MQTRTEILAAIIRLEGPCHPAFRAGREVEIARLRELLPTAPEEKEAPVQPDAAYERWLETQREDERRERRLERRGYE